jgi:hypothetical protein
MSALVLDLKVVRNWMRGGRSLVEAREAAEHYYRHRVAVADKIAAGRVGGAAARGRPRHCGICHETGHNRSVCPQREEHRRRCLREYAVKTLRGLADKLSANGHAEVVGRAANSCELVARQLAGLAVELQAVERAAAESGLLDEGSEGDG